MYSLMFFLLGCALPSMIFAALEGGKRIIKSGGLTAYEKQAIVDYHNRLRQSVALGQISNQPPAVNMMEMVWDDELAAKAQYWTDQCTIAHDKPTKRKVSRFDVGQNLAASWISGSSRFTEDPTPEFNRHIKAWFDEVDMYKYGPISDNNDVTGHYTQLVWSDTSLIGCGFTFYYDPQRGNTKLYVCNYGPAGNVKRLQPYKMGEPSCKAVGLINSQNYTGLCSPGISSTSSQKTKTKTSVNKFRPIWRFIPVSPTNYYNQ